MYAVIETGGKQYQVKEGDTLFIEKLNVEAEQTVNFDKVVAVGTDKVLQLALHTLKMLLLKLRF